MSKFKEIGREKIQRWF